MPHITGIGTWFAPGSAAAANNASDDIDSTLAPGSNYYNAANTGQAGQDIIQGAANLQNVGADFGGMDADTAALGALSTQYLNNYLGGNGQMTQAQQAQSQADLERMNSSQLLGGSEKEANAVNNVKQQEDALNASGATSTRAQAAAMALKKATMQMLISHTNNMTAIEKQKLQKDVGLIGAKAAEELQSGANNARSNQMSIYESGRMAGDQTAISIGSALASSGAAVGGTIANMGSSSSLGSTSQNSLTSTSTPTTDTYSGGTGDSAGYATPSTSVSNLATGSSKLAIAGGSPTYSPFTTSQTNTAYPLASAWGMTSLNNTLPN
jgi:hypothetical protein